MPDLFARAVAQIATLDPDLLVVSGDLLDYPLDLMDDPDVRRWAEKDLRLIADLLLPISCPIAMVYGNHDHPELFRRVFGHVPSEQIAGMYRVLAHLKTEPGIMGVCRPAPDDVTRINIFYSVGNSLSFKVLGYTVPDKQPDIFMKDVA